MKFRFVFVLAMSGLLLFSQPAIGFERIDRGPQVTPLSCDTKDMSFHRHRARAILGKAYPVTYFSTHQVASKNQVAAFKEHKLCILDHGERRDLGARRHSVALFQRLRIASTPFARGDGTYWSIPLCHVYTESGFDYYPPDYGDGLNRGGAYGLLDSWHLRGGLRYASQANQALPWQQDLIAHVAWEAHDTWAACT